MMKQIFLSHSGADKEFVRDFSAVIEQAFGNELEVIFTARSECRHESDGSVGHEVSIGNQVDPELVKRYLLQNLANCQLYLLLATGNSLIIGNDWVSYEMQLATEERLAPVVVLIGDTPIRFRGDEDSRWKAGDELFWFYRKGLLK